MRKPGYYFVHSQIRGWIIAEWTEWGKDQFCWYKINNTYPSGDGDFLEINENRIIMDLANASAELLETIEAKEEIIMVLKQNNQILLKDNLELHAELKKNWFQRFFKL